MSTPMTAPVAVAMIATMTAAKPGEKAIALFFR